jgi:hypothetical protein
LQVVTLDAECDRQLQTCTSGQTLHLRGHLNLAGNWILVERLS